MALALTHMHPTDIRPLITKYKHHGSQANYRALWTRWSWSRHRCLAHSCTQRLYDHWFTTRMIQTKTVQWWYIHKHPSRSGTKHSTTLITSTKDIQAKAVQERLRSIANPFTTYSDSGKASYQRLESTDKRMGRDGFLSKPHRYRRWTSPSTKQRNGWRWTSSWPRRNQSNGCRLRT